MKKQVLMPAAERMYVVEQYTIDGIAEELGIAEKTVRLWKTEGNWDVKRQRLLKTKTDFHEDLYNFARKLMNVISLDLDNLSCGTGESDIDESIDKRIESRVNAMSRLLDKLPKTKDYEISVKKEKEDANKVDVSGDVIAQRVREILGG